MSLSDPSSDKTVRHLWQIRKGGKGTSSVGDTQYARLFWPQLTLKLRERKIAWEHDKKHYHSSNEKKFFQAYSLAIAWRENRNYKAYFPIIAKVSSQAVFSKNIGANRLSTKSVKWQRGDWCISLKVQKSIYD